MGLLISCYDSCCRPKIANGESINPYASAYRRQSEQDVLRERQMRDEVCGLLVPSPSKCSTARNAPIIKKPEKGMMYYSCTTYEFVK
ncbi:hypothetical protein DAPPUDRAFT_305467 [Daphnia pulex]|uniref:Uncharacterized protein n=1 Tax=Daphnia pulex TaxID=6669 RepID=E9FWV0_DAPPU|nr:hypothetical protein DAPPUDRAFT_305467 [Daphnia pulex]|eukprot:EFX88371.1 hypothetical protein DAPPUDRAFT_305467 [Daphnia pulex]